MFPFAHLGVPLAARFLGPCKDIDIRLLMLGSMLPDLMDKPLGHLIMEENNGRVFAHTLLFLLIFLIASLAFRRLMPVTLGIGIHQLLDMTFMAPRGALWPLAGGFEATEFKVGEWLDAAWDPWIITGEITGVILIVYMVLNWKLYRKEELSTVIKKGRLG